MNYYYDLNLDFLKDNFVFYEVDSSDIFKNVKKIPLIQVDTKTLKDLILNQVKVSMDFLNTIENKTLTNDEVIPYAVILADKNNAIAFNFNNEGINIEMSPLPIQDELNILEVIYTIKEQKIDYEKITKRKRVLNLRKEEKIKEKINKEIKKLYTEKKEAKLQFLYLEWFDTFEDNIEIIYQKMQEKLRNEITSREEKILKIIEMSYNNV